MTGYVINESEQSQQNDLTLNECIGDDTKAAARQSLNCIKNQKIKYGVERFSVWRMKFLHPAIWHDGDIDFTSWLHAPCNVDVACGSGIVTVNSPSGNTLQCDTWLWDDCAIEFAQTLPFGILHLVSISTTSHRYRHLYSPYMVAQQKRIKLNNLTKAG